MVTTHVANVEMAAAWDGPEGEHWTAHADHYERVSPRHWERLVDTVAISADAAVLDVGCGTGRSTRDLARIATRGEVMGIDLSSRMLQYGRDRAQREGLTNVRFEQGDAEVYALTAEAYDVAVSVFGAMFFGNPVAAFANIRSAMKPASTLALLTWRELSRNDWLVSLRRALALGRTLPEPPTSAPGPFGLADQGHVRTVLSEAGYTEVTLHEVNETLIFGRDSDEAFAFVSAMGITKGLLHDLDEDAKAQGVDNLRRLIADRDTGDGVQFGSSAWLITGIAG